MQATPPPEVPPKGLKNTGQHFSSCILTNTKKLGRLLKYPAIFLLLCVIYLLGTKAADTYFITPDEEGLKTSLRSERIQNATPEQKQAGTNFLTLLHNPPEGLADKLLALEKLNQTPNWVFTPAEGLTNIPENNPTTQNVFSIRPGKLDELVTPLTQAAAKLEKQGNNQAANRILQALFQTAYKVQQDPSVTSIQVADLIVNRTSQVIEETPISLTQKTKDDIQTYALNNSVAKTRALQAEYFRKKAILKESLSELHPIERLLTKPNLTLSQLSKAYQIAARGGDPNPLLEKFLSTNKLMANPNEYLIIWWPGSPTNPNQTQTSPTSSK